VDGKQLKMQFISHTKQQQKLALKSELEHLFSALLSHYIINFKVNVKKASSSSKKY
jgi:hypothetical protein